MLLNTSSRDMLSDAWRGSQKIRFLAVGVWNTAFAYAAVFALYGCFQRHLHYLVINAIAHLFAVANAFVCQRFIVFRSRTPWGSAFLRFNLVQLMMLAVSMTALSVMVEVLHFHPLFSQLVVMTSCIIASYLLNRSYSFKAPNP
jgi:putative flippase GtrA